MWVVVRPTTTVANGTLYALVWALVPGMAEVIPLS